MVWLRVGVAVGARARSSGCSIRVCGVVFFTFVWCSLTPVNVNSPAANAAFTPHNHFALRLHLLRGVGMGL